MQAAMIKKINRFLLLLGLAWLLDPGSSLQADCGEAVLLEKANVAFCQLMARPRFLRPCLPSLLRNAQGVAIFPCSIMAAVGVGGQHGRGVLLIRGADGSWGPPVFLTLSLASAGIQLGVEETDLVLIFRTRRSLEHMNKGKLILGVGGTLAVGSIGCEKIIGADVCLQTAIFSNSHSNGLFIGNRVAGVFLRIDAAATAAYEQDCLHNGGPTGPGASPSLRLQMKLAEFSAPAPYAAAPSGAAPPPSPQP
jgi:lipid-binding SYLF domain-containing protein